MAEPQHDPYLDTAEGFRAAVVMAAAEGKPFTVQGVRFVPERATETVRLRGRIYTPIPLGERATQTTMEVLVAADWLNGIHLPPGERYGDGEQWMSVPTIVRFTGASA